MSNSIVAFLLTSGAAAIGNNVQYSADVLATANQLSSDAYPKALCLDGSPGRYYFRPGRGSGRKKFYVHQEGGGFCTNDTDCLQRASTNLGSTLATVPNAWGPTLNLTAWAGYFSPNSSLNPLLADWNHVFMVYCDGAYFSGDNSSRIVVEGKQLHYSGRHILDAVLDDLASQHNLNSATDVILGGCSAGAIATYAHLDYVSAKLSAGLASHARVAGFADSGFYADVPFFTSQKVFPFHAQNASSTLSQECLHQQQSAPHKCLVAEINAAYLHTPLFAWQSQFDADQLATSLSPPCHLASCADPYAAHLLGAMKKTLFRGTIPHGAFVDGCWRHCGFSPGGGDIKRIFANGVTPLWALLHWYNGATASKETDRLTVQKATTFPCKECCPRPTGDAEGSVLV